MTEPQQEATDDDRATTAGEEDHSNLEAFRGDEADPPVNDDGGAA